MPAFAEVAADHVSKKQAQFGPRIPAPGMQIMPALGEPPSQSGSPEPVMVCCHANSFKTA